MPIKLIKVCKEYNITMQRVVEFLRIKGHEVALNLNSRITDEQYALIQQEFNAPPLLAIVWKEDVFTLDAQTNRERIDTLGWNKMRNDTFVITPNMVVLIPHNQSCNHFSYWTKADFEGKSQDAYDGRYIRKIKLGAPSGELPILPFVEVEVPEFSKTKEKEPETFSIGKPKVKAPSAIGRIDLSQINQATRPSKKSKEEKRAERNKRKEERKMKQEATLTTPTSYSADMIRDVWQRFVDIQETLIRQKCHPIAIDVESEGAIIVENDKIYAYVDDRQDEEQIKKVIEYGLHADEYDLDKGYVIIPEEKWGDIEPNNLAKICRSLQQKYLDLDPIPAINVTIDYSRSAVRTDQLTLSELRQLDEAIKAGSSIEGSVSDIASFICNDINIDITAYKRHLFGDHCITTIKKKKNGTEKSHTRIEYKNSYIPWHEYIRYNEQIGLRCTGYTLVFKINSEYAREKLNEVFWEVYFKDDHTFEFKQSFKDKCQLTENFIDIINHNISFFLREASLYCEDHDIQITVLFRYEIDNKRIIELKFREIAAAIANRDNYSFNPSIGALGIDFNWRKEDITKKIEELEREVPFVQIRPFNNDIEQHKFKCRTAIRIANFEQIKRFLEETFDGIHITNDSLSQKIYIKLPYTDSSNYDEQRWYLEQALNALNISNATITFSQKIEGKITLTITNQKDSRLQDIRDSILEMRRADFGIEVGEKEFTFGRLLNAYFEGERIRMVFDVTIDDEERKEQFIEAFRQGACKSVIPILTGDLEKISRLKNTFTMATTGEELVNPRLQNFIFDASQATATQDIDNILNRNGHTYKDLCSHLLNSQINESQKQAILKAIWAEDLAVIQGPPGTGKSTAIAELIWQLVRTGYGQGNERERILLTSETNLAVDNAISRILNTYTNLVKPVRFGDEEKLESEGLQFSIELMERWVKEGDACLVTSEEDEETGTIIRNDLVLRNWLDNISRRSFSRTIEESDPVIHRWRKFLHDPDEDTREAVFKRYLEEVNVIGATCSSIGDIKANRGNFAGFTSFFHNYCKVLGKEKATSKVKIKFTTVIQDESSKATPAELVLPFVYGKRAIVIGDHRQLPPMLDKEEFNESLAFAKKYASTDGDKKEIENLQAFVEKHFAEMEISHFQRLYERIDNSLKGTFNLQYRMHPAINSVIEQFYREDGGLRCGLVYPQDRGVNDSNFSNPASRYHGIDIPGLITPNTHVLFINSDSPEMLDGTSRVNFGEIEAIDMLLSRFEKSTTFQTYLSKFKKEEEKQIGIISFYGKQIKHIRNVARQHFNLPIRISTVDRFQGMERNIVIVSMVRSNTIQSARGQHPDFERYPELGYPRQRSLGFAQSPNRLNVALSRAKRLLIIIGNEKHFSEKEIYLRLFHTIRANSENTIINLNEL